MTPEQGNVIIAEAAGLQLSHDKLSYCPYGLDIRNQDNYLPVPKYHADLNAIHGAMRAVRYNNQFFFFEYQKNLWRVVTGREWSGELDYQFSISMFEVTTAAAPQCWEAFLGAIKKPAESPVA